MRKCPKHKTKTRLITGEDVGWYCEMCGCYYALTKDEERIYKCGVNAGKESVSYMVKKGERLDKIVALLNGE